MIEQKDLKRFWEWCRIYKGQDGWWNYPDCQRRRNKPPLDLNSLFRWAVPKLEDWSIARTERNDGEFLPCADVAITEDGKWYYGHEYADDPAEAIFRAILTVIDHDKSLDSDKFSKSPKSHA